MSVIPDVIIGAWMEPSTPGVLEFFFCVSGVKPFGLPSIGLGISLVDM